METEEEQKISALSITCFFQFLSTEELKQLASIFIIKTMSIDELLVKQNEPASDYFIILSGEAEVWVNYDTNKPILVATLSANDVIGHIDIDGKEPIIRNATVKAITSISVMVAPVKKIEPFLHKHHEIQSCLNDYRQKTNTINFIKSSTPFIDISSETANELVYKLQNQTFEKDADIIKQGDLADKCYLLEEGTVSVIIQDEEGNEKIIKELNRGDLFGELGLFEGNRRNATIRAKTHCRLLSLSREDFLYVLTSHDDVAKKVSYLSKHRNRPKRMKEVIVIEQTDHSGAPVYILKNPTNRKYLKIQNEGWYIWQQMDGLKTIHELIVGYLDAYGKFLPQQIMKLILDLESLDMVEMTYYKLDEQTQTLKSKFIYYITKIFEVKVTFRNVDQRFTKIYNSFGYLIYNKYVISCLSILIFTGILTFTLQSDETHRLFKSNPHNYQFLIYVYLTLPFTITLHEFAHGLTAKSIGCEVGGFGVGWYWFGPIAFCDTTDSWIAPSKDRIKVNLAGFFSDLCFAGLSSILSLVFQGSDPGIFFWLLAASFYVISIINMGTLIELDGYYVLSDVLNEPNLRRKAFLWIDKLPKQIFHTSLLRENYKLVIYWVVSVLYIFLVVYSYSTFQNKILFYALPVKVFHYREYVQLILPVLLVIFIFISVRADIKKYE